MGIGNNVRVSSMIPRVVNGNGNGVLASRLPWRDEHQRAGAELALWGKWGDRQQRAWVDGNGTSESHLVLVASPGNCCCDRVGFHPAQHVIRMKPCQCGSCWLD